VVCCRNIGMFCGIMNCKKCALNSMAFSNAKRALRERMSGLKDLLRKSLIRF
jgi:hypothetical protein